MYSAARCENGKFVIKKEVDRIAKKKQTKKSRYCYEYERKQHGLAKFESGKNRGPKPSQAKSQKTIERAISEQLTNRKEQNNTGKHI